MATNKKITELTELVGVDLADDDVIPIVDISAGTTHKIQKSTLAAAVAGVAELAATTPIAVDTATGDVTISISATPSFTTVSVTGDTSAGDDAKIGYTAAEGLILTGQGSTNDVTIKNDADADVLKIATGGTDVAIVGGLTLGTDLSVANGGTGRSTLTANYALLGNGTTALQMIAPGTSGNTLTSDGSTWASTAASAGGAGYFLGNSSGATGDTTNGLTDIFRVNNPTLATSVVIAASTNASATGPLAVNSGITLTVTGTLVII